MTDYFSHIPDTLDRAPTRAAKPNAPTFPCMSCAGTGRWSGGRNRTGEDKCFACGGKGSYKTSAQDRSKARANVQARKERKAAAGEAALNAEHGGLIERARAVASWHSFAATMLEKLAQYGSLTENQTAALKSSLDKADAAIARKRAERAANGGDIDVARIDALFATARRNGLSEPSFRTPELTLSLAKPGSPNAGAIYVKSSDRVYLGKISGGTFHARSEATPATLEALRAIAADPLGVAKKYAEATKGAGLNGRCSCCGLRLTDPESVKRGIGPICARKWGI